MNNGKNVLNYDAKRNFSSQEKIENWCQYYAGYSARFAKDVIRYADLNPDSIILDPWNGSGTTTHIANELGYLSIGVDLNPVAILIAKAKLVRFDDANQIAGLVYEICGRLKEKKLKIKKQYDPLDNWLNKKMVAQYRFLEGEILKHLATTGEKITFTPSSGKISNLASFLVFALIRAAKELAAIPSGSNPTWVKKTKFKNNIGDLADLWLSFVISMAQDIPVSTLNKALDSQILIGDSRKIPLEDNSIDFVLTSPPYCTRIDYAISTSFELCALSIDIKHKDFKEFRREIMGAPLVRPLKIYEPKEIWVNSVKKILNQIKNHPSKASSSYYYKTYWNYFSDCHESINEIDRVCKDDCNIFFVVQGSFYKEIYVDLPSLYKEMFENIGYSVEIISENLISHSLSQINVKSLPYRSLESMQKESVLHIRRI